MQKHERDILKAAQVEAARWGLEATVKPSVGQPKLRLCITGPGGQRCKHIPSSPKNTGESINYTRRFVRIVAPELAGKVS